MREFTNHSILLETIRRSDEMGYWRNFTREFEKKKKKKRQLGNTGKEVE